MVPKKQPAATQRPLPPGLDRAFLNRIRDTILAVEPGARVILYGSRARGDAAPDSDWNLLVLLDGPVDSARVRRVRHQLYELELETAMVLSSIVRSKEDWESKRYRALPFHANIMREGLMCAP